MKLELPSTITSLQDLTTLIDELQNYSRFLSHSSILQRVTQRTKRSTAAPPALSPDANTLLHTWGVNQNGGQKALAELLKVLEEAKTKAPIMTITLASPPTTDTTTSLTEWCRKNIASNVLITFQFNSIILGGLIVRCGSHIYDWSFRRQILTNGKRFTESLRHV